MAIGLVIPNIIYLIAHGSSYCFYPFTNLIGVQCLTAPYSQPSSSDYNSIARYLTDQTGTEDCHRPGYARSPDPSAADDLAFLGLFSCSPSSIQPRTVCSSHRKSPSWLMKLRTRRNILGRHLVENITGNNSNPLVTSRI